MSIPTLTLQDEGEVASAPTYNTAFSELAAAVNDVGPEQLHDLTYPAATSMGAVVHEDSSLTGVSVGSSWTTIAEINGLSYSDVIVAALFSGWISAAPSDADVQIEYSADGGTTWIIVNASLGPVESANHGSIETACVFTAQTLTDVRVRAIDTGASLNIDERELVVVVWR